MALPGWGAGASGGVSEADEAGASAIDYRQPIASAANHVHHRPMLNLLSLLIGAVALVLGVLAFFPLLGWAYWLIIPIALVGAGIGVVSDKNSGRNLNLVVVAVGVVRLMIGGGII